MSYLFVQGSVSWVSATEKMCLQWTQIQTAVSERLSWDKGLCTCWRILWRRTSGRELNVVGLNLIMSPCLWLPRHLSFPPAQVVKVHVDSPPRFHSPWPSEAPVTLTVQHSAWYCGTRSYRHPCGVPVGCSPWVFGLWVALDKRSETWNHGFYLCKKSKIFGITVPERLLWN